MKDLLGSEPRHGSERPHADHAGGSAGPNVLGGDAPFPLAQSGIVTIPAGFLAAIAGTLVGERRAAGATATAKRPPPRPDRGAAA
ncbi:MAG: hypothetical protein AABM31_05990 [Actinomycetota bacterium]